MLALIADELRGHGLLGAGDEADFDISPVNAQALNIAAHARSGASFQIRVKKSSVRPDEYRNWLEAWQAFPQHAPQPLFHHVEGDWDLIAMRGVPHRPVSPGDLARDRGGLVGQIVGYLEASARGAQTPAPGESHRMFLQSVLGRATSAGNAKVVQEWMVNRELEGLSSIRQHGDFVVNNLGCTVSGLVVFDWEDFGEVAIPGLDLCTVLASDAGFDPALLRAISDGRPGVPRPYSELLDRGCPAIGLTPDLFRRLVPLYLAVFLDLKRDYGLKIAGLVETALHGIGTPGGRDDGLVRA